MNTDVTLPTRQQVKAQAKRLRTALADKGESIGHSQSLELVAQQYGYRDWNTMHAALGNGPDKRHLSIGDRVSGVYLKQAFEGDVVALEQLSAGRRRVTIRFDKAVDVVAFKSFSAFRQRVTVVIDEAGHAVSKTSDGAPHLTLN